MDVGPIPGPHHQSIKRLCVTHRAGMRKSSRLTGGQSEGETNSISLCPFSSSLVTVNTQRSAGRHTQCIPFVIMLSSEGKEGGGVRVDRDDPHSHMNDGE